MKNVWLDGDGNFKKELRSLCESTVRCWWPEDLKEWASFIAEEVLPTVIYEDCKAAGMDDIYFVSYRLKDVMRDYKEFYWSL